MSLFDDVVSLSTGVRFAVQFAAAGAVVAAAFMGHPIAGSSGMVIAIGALFVVGAVGLLNIYNFMDGIVRSLAKS